MSNITVPAAPVPPKGVCSFDDMPHMIPCGGGNLFYEQGLVMCNAHAPSRCRRCGDWHYPPTRGGVSSGSCPDKNWWRK